MRRGTEDDRAESRGKGHGRIEIRRIRTTTRLTGSLDWPGVKQVRLRARGRRSRGRETTETVRAITSLEPERAWAQRRRGIARGHWEIEDRVHWVRDLSLGEDTCRVHSGEAPEILAARRQAVLRLMRSSGRTAIATALRRHPAKPLEARRLVTSFAPS